MRRTPLILLLVSQLTPFTLAQQPGNPQPGDPPNRPPPTVQSQRQQATPATQATDDDVVKITTNLVQVDAIVTDKSGKLIRDPQPLIRCPQIKTRQRTKMVVSQNSWKSAATWQFKPGQILQYSFFVYNARLDKATPQPQLRIQLRLFLDGKPVYAGKETALVASNQPDLKRIGVEAAIQLGKEIAPGEYALQVVVTDPLADQKYQVTTQWMDFEIVK